VVREPHGFDISRMALLGWSMGGSGALLLAEASPGFARAVAAFSADVSPGDQIFTAPRRPRGTPVGLWCGRQDGLLSEVRAAGTGAVRAARRGQLLGGPAQLRTLVALPAGRTGLRGRGLYGLDVRSVR